MAIPCPRCGRQYDSTLFAFDRTVLCACGVRLDRSASIAPPDPAAGDEAARLIRSEADRIARLFDENDLPAIDLKIAVADLRRLIRRLAPDREHLFDWIYRPRFERMLEERRGAERG